MNLNVKAKLPTLHNHFDIKVRDSITNEIIREARAENVVLDRYLAVLFRGNSYYELSSIAYGDGTGVPDRSRTSLFNYKDYDRMSNFYSRRVVTTPDLVTITGKIIIGSNSYIGGRITEVGLATSASRYIDMLATHAMLQDINGAPITLGPKTNTEIWELSATLYIENNPKFVDFPNALSKAVVNGGGSPFIRCYIQPQNIAVSMGATFDPVTKTLSSSSETNIQTTEGNNYPGLSSNISKTTDMVSILFTDLREDIKFPNHDIFPPFTFSERVIGVGDGNRTDFNFDSNYFIDGSEVIRKDGVIQEAGIDYITHQGARRIANVGMPHCPLGDAIPFKVYSSNASKDQLSERLPGSNPYTYTPRTYYLIDFLEVGRIPPFAITPMYSESTSTAGQFDFEISDDLLTWVDVTALLQKPETSGPIMHNEDRLITARYLWIKPSARYVKDFYVFGKPSIEFLEPVEDGAEIRASWTTEYPPKNENFSYKISGSVTGVW